MAADSLFQQPKTRTGAIAFADGTVWQGTGTGAEGVATGEICFNTAMTGYQEILTDPSYASQIVLFTFPHIGIVGTNKEDIETSSSEAKEAVRGAVFREQVPQSSNYRSKQNLNQWLVDRNIVAVSGVDTRSVTRRIRKEGMAGVAVAHHPNGEIDFDDLVKFASRFEGLEGKDLAKDVSTLSSYTNSTKLWSHSNVSERQEVIDHNVVVIDFGIKCNILRNLAEVGARTTVVSSDTSFETIAKLNPDGVVLSNGPGDPSATSKRIMGTVYQLIESGLPVLGICLGHQLLALSVGAETKKMVQGHHGANHPVLDVDSGNVEIVSMNHGFTVDVDTLPDGVIESHRSLFDGTNSGLRFEGKPIISVQHHPEASPGPQDSFYVFSQFAELMRKYKE